MDLKQKIFFDTNVLVYQFDRSAPTKQKQAEALIKQCMYEGRAVISSQVVQEFMNVALHKFDTQLPFEELKIIMDDLLDPLLDHTPTFGYYERVLMLYVTHRMSFYDTMIIQAAIDLNCDILYSEDLQAGQQFGSVTIVNPFSKG